MLNCDIKPFTKQGRTSGHSPLDTFLRVRDVIRCWHLQHFGGDNYLVRRFILSHRLCRRLALVHIVGQPLQGRSIFTNLIPRTACATNSGPLSKRTVVRPSSLQGRARGGQADPLDNVEGITLGPKLPDGRQSVVLVSDNNFATTQITQFLLLAM